MIDLVHIKPRREVDLLPLNLSITSLSSCYSCQRMDCSVLNQTGDRKVVYICPNPIWGFPMSSISNFRSIVLVLSLQMSWLPEVVAAEPVPAQVEVLARIHFNTQTRDFDLTRAFYRQLGYTQGVGGFPKTNTTLMARSLGMYDLCTYELEDIEVMSIPNANGSTSIDLIQFAVPYNDDPPYSKPNHLGMAYAAMRSTDFLNDYAYLRQQGVDFLSEPVGSPGQRFVFMRDPDGVYLKLLEGVGNSEMDSDERSTVNINAMPYIGVNVGDFDASLNFYRNLGYTEIEMLPENGSLAESQAYGLDQAFEIRGADISLSGGDGNTIRLVQWIEPFDPSPPYPAPISHIGIHRIALAVANLDSAVAALENEGFKFLSEIAPCCSGTGEDEIGIINAIDPDGIFVELVGPISRRPLQEERANCADATSAADSSATRDVLTSLGP
ncbi:MAG: catechol 2,3-dioxygenase-like lactoylglutathione lyase family enzyme [Cyclobacteriaceae bacterium]